MPSPKQSNFVVHQSSGRSSPYSYYSSGSSNRSSNQSTSSQPSSGDYTSSSGAYDSYTYRSGHADDFTVQVRESGENVVINHHRSNPSYDEPRASESRDPYHYNSSNRRSSQRGSKSSKKN